MYNVHTDSIKMPDELASESDDGYGSADQNRINRKGGRSNSFVTEEEAPASKQVRTPSEDFNYVITCSSFQNIVPYTYITRVKNSVLYAFIS